MGVDSLHPRVAAMIGGTSSDYWKLSTIFRVAPFAHDRRGGGMKNLLRIFWQRILELWRGSLGDRLSVIQAIFAVVLTVTSLALHYYREYQDAYLKETTLTFEKQIETLDGVQKSLKYLTAFVIEQRRKLQE